MRAIVVGAGPGGAVAALELARGGASVTLVDKSAWPRAKTCGDGVSPLGVRELAQLGVRFDETPKLTCALVTTPRGTAFRGNFPADAPHGTIVERRILDDALVRAAISAGADFLPSTCVRSLEPGDTSVSAVMASPASDHRERYDVAVLAEGATGSLARALGFPPYRSRLIALRGYADAPRDLAPEYGVFYDRPLSPGYGWIFPVSERRANVGILVDARTLSRLGGDLRGLLSNWLTRSAACRELFSASPLLENVRGGVIPSGRKKRTAGRVFLVGDAAGVADPFTAEGIYEAMHTGRSAARSLLLEPDIVRATKRYAQDVRTFDHNERAARLLRATFDMSIEPFARRAQSRPLLASQLNTDVFFIKRSFAHFVIKLLASSLR